MIKLVRVSDGQEIRFGDNLFSGVRATVAQDTGIITVDGVAYQPNKAMSAGSVNTQVAATATASGGSGSSAGISITHVSPIHGQSIYASPTTILCENFPFTVSDTNCIVASVEYRTAADQEWKRINANDSGVSITAAADVITVTKVGLAFTDTDEFRVYLAALPNYEDKYREAIRTVVDNPDYEDFQVVQHIEALSVDAGTYRSVFSASNYRNLSMQVIAVDDVTVTVHKALNDLADDTADDGWADVTEQLTGSATLTDCNICVDVKGSKAEQYMIKYVTATATNALDVYYSLFN